LKALAKEPGRRYGTARALAEDLRRFLAGEPIRARPTGRVERVAKWVRRRPAAAALLLVGLLLAVGLPARVVWFTAHRAAKQEAAEAADRERGLRDVAEERRKEAEQARQGELEQRQRAEQLLNGIRVSQAHALWRDSHLALADELLDLCPPDTRFWDWR